MFSLTDVSIFNEQGLKPPPPNASFYTCRAVSDQPLVPALVLQQTAVDIESKMGIFTGFSFLSQRFMSKRLFAYQYLLE